MVECLLENRQIIQVRRIRQDKSLDWTAKRVAEESQPEGVQCECQKCLDVWDGDGVQEGRMAGSVSWGRWGASHVPRPRLKTMGHHR